MPNRMCVWKHDICAHTHTYTRTNKYIIAIQLAAKRMCFWLLSLGSFIDVYIYVYARMLSFSLFMCVCACVYACGYNQHHFINRWEESMLDHLEVSSQVVGCATVLLFCIWRACVCLCACLRCICVYICTATIHGVYTNTVHQSVERDGIVNERRCSIAAIQTTPLSVLWFVFLPSVAPFHLVRCSLLRVVHTHRGAQIYMLYRIFGGYLFSCRI